MSAVDRFTDQIAQWLWELPTTVSFDKLFPSLNLHVVADDVLEHKRLRRVRVAPIVVSETVNHREQRIVCLDRRPHARGSIRTWIAHQPRRKLPIHLLEINRLENHHEIFR